MSQCHDAESCKKTGEWLCNCKQSKDHPVACCIKSSCLSFIHCLSCTAIMTSNKPYEVAVQENRLDPRWEDDDPCYNDEGHCCGFFYHTIVFAVCLPFMVLSLLSGFVCYCIGCWNGCCGCDEKCSKSNTIEPGGPDMPIQTQPASVWTTNESGHWQ